MNDRSVTSNQSPLSAGDKFVAMFKREPSSPSDLAWMNGYATAIAERVVAELHGETPAKHPYLLNATRFKMSFDRSGRVNCFSNYEKMLDGLWVALVHAEDDVHMKGYAPVTPKTSGGTP